MLPLDASRPRLANWPLDEKALEVGRFARDGFATAADDLRLLRQSAERQGERAEVSNLEFGYVTDVPYVPGYYVQQSPVHMVVAARAAGVACDLPEDDDPVHVLELGCGVGVGALVAGRMRTPTGA